MELSHLDAANQPTMVDISSKPVTERQATARALVTLPKEFGLFAEGHGAHTAKGPIFATAIIAGTLGAKKTSELIPFCHPLAIESCKFQLTVLEPHQLQIDCTVKISGPTGVEMEAIIGVSVAAATVYDMAKALTHEMVIGPISLVHKSGGKRDVVESTKSTP
jgi:cyclic pyranopterin phosphate synthase